MNEKEQQVRFLACSISTCSHRPTLTPTHLLWEEGRPLGSEMGSGRRPRLLAELFWHGTHLWGHGHRPRLARPICQALVLHVSAPPPG